MSVTVRHRAGVQPCVLVGGLSRRFGRDKLREPWRGSEGGEWLVDQPRLSLRAVLGAPVWAVGDCDAAVASRFDRALPDDFPGSGPLGGILTALRAAGRDVLVLAGDLAWIDRDSLIALLTHAGKRPDAAAVAARTDRWEPCIGVYRSACASVLESRLAAGDLAAHAALDALQAEAFEIGFAPAASANRRSDLGSV